MNDIDSRPRRFPAGRWAAGAAALCLFAAFYYKYVPLVPGFQAVLVPVLLAAAGAALLSRRLGLLAFTFLFPLVNILPYFFGLHDPLPHAPAALVLGLAFLLGALFREAVRPARLDFGPSVVRPMMVLAALATVSALVTFLRFANFAPFLSSGAYELAVNVNGTRAGGGMMSTVFNFLSYGTGFLVFLVAVPELRDRAFLRKVLGLLGVSMTLAVLFALVQKTVSIELGNFPHWSGMGRLNGTFKDPNSFGACLAAAIPLFIAWALATSGIRRVLSLLAAVLGLFVLPSTGSRSTYLGVGLGLLLLLAAARRRRGPGKRAPALATALIAALILALILIPLVLKQTELTKRFASNLETLVHKGKVDEVVTGRWTQWGIALDAIREFPATGLGIGAFIIELPNYSRERGLPTAATDSTENYYLQAGSEMGLAGLAALLWLTGEILLQARRRWRAPAGDPGDDWLIAGLTSGLLVLAFNQLLHSYVGAFDVSFLFWILAAGLFAGPAARPRAKPGAGIRIAAFGALAVFGAASLAVSLGPLSIAERAEKFGWPQEFGFYAPEKDGRGLDFRWTGRTAGLVLDRLGDRVVFPVLASHPDIADRPVRLTVFLADRRFRKGAVLGETRLGSRDWTEIAIPLEAAGDRIPLIFEIARTWVPRAATGVPDPRILGIGLGREWYERTARIPPGAAARTEAFPASGWAGDYGASLVTVAKSGLRFSSGPGAFGFRFLARGDKARGFPPYIIVSLDGRVVGKLLVRQTGWEPVVFPADLPAGEHLLEVEFVNDDFDPAGGEDRNVFLGDLEVLYR